MAPEESEQVRVGRVKSEGSTIASVAHHDRTKQNKTNYKSVPQVILNNFYILTHNNDDNNYNSNDTKGNINKQCT